ncbi:MAG TPA: winged helix-turn-helix domain-containing protein [Nitrososphaerales archaeon]|nr:winged helix-turn-helix domain-containing protein [Nitrososphaerales archaeon]
MEGRNSDRDVSKADLFEAMGHPTRIRILQSLATGPLGFSELKHSLGIESNGLLAFHLGKMGEFVRENSEGKYLLTDYGVEALRLSYMLEKPAGNSGGMPLRVASGISGTRVRKLIVLAVVLMAVVAVAAFAVVTYVGSAPVIVSPFTILPHPNLPSPRNEAQLSFTPFYNATAGGAIAYWQNFRLNTTSFVTGSFTSSNGIDVFITPTDSLGTLSASLYRGLGSVTGFTFTTGAVTNGTINVTLTAGRWSLLVIDPSSLNSTLSILQPIRAIALCNTGPVCSP